METGLWVAAACLNRMQVVPWGAAVDKVGGVSRDLVTKGLRCQV